MEILYTESQLGMLKVLLIFGLFRWTFSDISGNLDLKMLKHVEMMNNFYM